jgi:hypothetical protein
MERTVNELHDQFRTVSLHLDSLQAQLDAEFSQSHPQSSHMNPFKARERIQALTADLERVKQKQHSVMIAKQVY